MVVTEASLLGQIFIFRTIFQPHEGAYLLNIPYGLSKCFVYSESALSLQATSQAPHLFKSGVPVHVILIESWLFTKRGKVEPGTTENKTKQEIKMGFEP